VANAQRALDATGFKPSGPKTAAEHLSDWQFEQLRAMVKIYEEKQANLAHKAAATPVDEE